MTKIFRSLQKRNKKPVQTFSVIEQFDISEYVRLHLFYCIIFLLVCQCYYDQLGEQSVQRMMSDFIDFAAFDYASASKVYNDAFDEYLESLSYQDITGHDFYDNCSYSEDDDDPNDPKGGGKKKRKKKDDNSDQDKSSKCSKTQGKNSSNSSCCAP